MSEHNQTGYTQPSSSYPGTGTLFYCSKCGQCYSGYHDCSGAGNTITWQIFDPSIVQRVSALEQKLEALIAQLSEKKCNKCGKSIKAFCHDQLCADCCTKKHEDELCKLPY